MALKVLPMSSTAGPPVVSDTVSIVAADSVATIGSSWIDSTHIVNVVGWRSIVAHFDYNKASETSIQVRFLGSADGGTTFRNLGYKATQASGVSELTKDPLSLTAANFDDPDTIMSPPYSVDGIQQVKAQYRGQGGTGSPTLGIAISGSILPVAG